jgi:hypothetical protein
LLASPENPRSDACKTTGFSKRISRKNDRKLIDALRPSKVYRQYEKVFTEATGLHVLTA